MNIYVDESGSLNNKLKQNQDFIITLIVPMNKKKLERIYKRFVSANYDNLKALDKDNKMFCNGEFRELKGSQFDKPMKQKFVQFFSKEKHLKFTIFTSKMLTYRMNFARTLQEHLIMCCV